MWISVKRVFRSGFIDFWRNSVVSLSSVFVMTMTLFVIGAIVFLNATLESALTELQSKVDINVYFIPDAGESDILALQSKIEGLPEVRAVEYISRDAALADFRARHEKDQLTLQALDELGENPLGAVLNIRAKETSQYEEIAHFLEVSRTESPPGVSIIDEVNYFQNKVAIDRLAAIIASSERLSLGVTVILIILSILIAFNTIRLAIYTSRDEIAVMRLVGASNSYVRGPFVVEGVLAGVAAGIIALALFYPLTYWLGPLTASFFSGINVFDYYRAHFGQIFLIIMGSGITLGAFSSFLAVKRHLKV